MKTKCIISILFFIIACATDGISVSTIIYAYGHVTEGQDTIINQEPDFFYTPLKGVSASNQEYSIFSPDGNIEVKVNADVNQLSYSISNGAKSITTPSILDLTLSSVGKLAYQLELTDVTSQTIDEVLELNIGEVTHFRNHYNESVFSFKRGNGLNFNLIFRVYDEGVAYRFSFPENDGYSSLIITEEIAQYCFSDNLTAFVEPYNERGYTPNAIQNSFSRTLIPLTLTNNEISLCINEADNDNYARIGLKGFGGNKLQSFFLGRNQSLSLPFSCPWRYVVIGSTPIDLIQNKEMLHGLSPQADVDSDWDWIEPGKVFRSMELTTEGGKKSVDFCKEMNMQYMMFDAGWYGLGYGQSKEREPLKGGGFLYFATPHNIK
ncbi:MAG: glycoside hydrolase family 97 N-terminal domain-containing protein [Bacteroidales bacterium]|nr:glycoside hydrolase family 97 N-terminal domain-containing protein [Bacteroidales bacterium]